MMNNTFDGFFNGRRVLVTGHTGFKGSWLSIWLRELGAEVIGYSLDPPTNPSNFHLSRLENRIIHIQGDVRDQAKMTQTIQNYHPDIVFHLAAQPIVLASYREPKETFETNVMGTINIFEAIRRTESVKACVVITSDKVYEDKGWHWGYRENDTLGGYDPYSTSKAMTELAVASYRRSWRQKWSEESTTAAFSDHEVAIASVRAGNVIGGGDFAKFRLIPDFMRACLEGKEVEIRNPTNVRPWQHLLEPLSGYLWLAVNLLRNPEEFSTSWNFGPAEREPISCKMMIEKTIELWGGGSFNMAPGQYEGHETSVLRVNWDNAAYRLEWAPAYSWQDALTETVNWWKIYEANLKHDSEIDMYQVCVNHIHDYVKRAKQQNIRWAVYKESN